MECAFTCSWFYSYRSDCVAVPCLSVGTSCEAAGAPSGEQCAKWCCVYEPVRGLIFLPVAIAVVFVTVVLCRCFLRWVITSRRKLRAARKAENEEPTFDDSEDDEEEVSSKKGGSNSIDTNTWHEPTEPVQLYNRKMIAPTTRSLAYPLDRSSSPPKDLSSPSPPPQQPESASNDFEEYQSDDEEEGKNHRRKPWYA